MKDNYVIKEVIIGIALLILLFLFINPYNWVPVGDMFEVIAIISLAVFFVFAFFICHHKKNDERDDYVLFLGERFGFIAGSAILMIGLLIQAKAHEVDIWMAVAFTGMILAKIVGMIYAKLKY